MGIQLIARDERLSVEIDGSTFFYKRMPADKKGRLLKQHAKRGAVDYDSAAEDAVAWGLLDWTNVSSRGADGQVEDVPFDKALVPLLPGSVRGELAGLVMGGDIEEGGPADPLSGSGATGAPS